MQGFTSDRGTEEFSLFKGEAWHKMFGYTLDFKKHGQPLRETAAMIEAGGQVYCKRIVASDAQLANLGVYVHVQRMASDGSVLPVAGGSSSTTPSSSGTGTGGSTSGTGDSGSGTGTGTGGSSSGTTTTTTFNLDDPAYSSYRADFVWPLTAEEQAWADAQLAAGKTATYILTEIPGQRETTLGESYDFDHVFDISKTSNAAFLAEFGVLTNAEQIKANQVVAGGGTDSDAAAAIRTLRASGYPDDLVSGDGTTVINTPSGNKVVLKYNAISLTTTSNDMERLASQFEAAIPASTDNDIVLPLFIVAGAGRGKWAPRFRISPDYRFSRGSGYAKYLFETIDSDDPMNEEIYFAADPNRVEKEKNISLEMQIEDKSNKVRVLQWEDNFDILRQLEESILGLTEGSLKDIDFLFGNDIKGFSINGIEVDNSEFNLQNVYGNLLENGSNGSFGDYPLDTEEYTRELVKLYNGTYAEEIYNLDSLSLDLVVDANYPNDVKRAIEEFVTFREDCFYVRDLGLHITGISDIESAEYDVLHNRYSSSYCNSMTVIDDQTKKYIDVTITYLLAPALIIHFINGCNRPFAGIRYGVFWQYGVDIRKNSINFLPKVTPSVDEKQQLEDLGVNYVSIYKSGNTRRVVLETLYTAQHVNMQSQLSFSCNVWCIQQVVKALRERCPKSRYAFMRGNDLEDYQSDLKQELGKFSSNFLSFDMEYQHDAAYEAQKIYYAVLKVTFVDFIQAEFFKIVAMPTV